MYSDELNKKKVIEVDIYPISKWRRFLLFLGDFFLHFIVSVILMTVAVMPIATQIRKPQLARSYEAEKKRDDVLYEYGLLFYKTEDEGGTYVKYDFDGDLKYTFNRFLAYYVMDGEESYNPTYPEYSHLVENEVIWKYYNNIRSDTVTYYQLFSNLNEESGVFTIEGTNISLSQEVKDEVKYVFIPGESMGTKGDKYYEQISDIFYAMYGVVFQDIAKNDLVSTDGTSYNAQQAIIKQIANSFYTVLCIACVISFVLGWAVIYILYPLLNRFCHTPTGSIMRVDRLGFKHLYPVNKVETIMTSLYHLVLNLPMSIFLALSYTTFIYTLNMPALPILVVITFLFLLASLFIMLFNGFNRTAVDLLSQTVVVDTDQVDGIIKAQETAKELEIAERREQERLKGESK